MQSNSIVPDIELLSARDLVDSLLSCTRLHTSTNAATNNCSARLAALSGTLTNSQIVPTLIADVTTFNDERASLDAAELESKAVTLRMRIVASCLGLGTVLTPTEQIEQITLSNKLSYVRVQDLLILLPEPIQTEAEEQKMLADLEQVYDQHNCRYKWIIDCSALHSFSGILFGNFIYYQDRLREKNKGLYLYWLHPDVLPEAKMKVLKKILNLVQIGGQHFSSDQFS